MPIGTWWQWWKQRRWLRWRKSSARAAAERRRAQRHSCTLDSSCWLIASVVGDPQIVRVRNISATGISLILDGSVEPETVIYLELLNRPKSYLCLVRLRVLYCVEHPDGVFIVGGAFQHTLTDEQLVGLLS
jgi:hypothetical protein